MLDLRLSLRVEILCWLEIRPKPILRIPGFFLVPFIPGSRKVAVREAVQGRWLQVSREEWSRKLAERVAPAGPAGKRRP